MCKTASYARECLPPTMHLHADFSKRAIVAAHQYQWVASPQAGVERVMLDRIGEEKARATSIVRYAEGSFFPAHSHPGGEEILVLSGTFSEDDRHYPAGWYLRNPPGSAHQPASEEGAVIFVKLRQMPESEQAPVRIDTRSPANWVQQGTIQVCPLFTSEAEHVRLLRLPAQEPLAWPPTGGAELLVIEGTLVADGQNYAGGSWLRFPSEDSPQVHAGPEGVTVYVKTGHLPPDGPGA